MAPRFFIFTEGVTEEKYLNSFRRRGMAMSVLVIQAGNTDPRGIISYCITELKLRGYGSVNGDRAAVVFDRDMNTSENLAEAKRLAAESGIEMFMSNPSFEFWLLLHYEDVRRCMCQDELEELLTKIIGHRYSKGEDLSKKITIEMIRTAIRRSERLLPNPEVDLCLSRCPSTMVHSLAKDLLSLSDT